MEKFCNWYSVAVPVCMAFLGGGAHVAQYGRRHFSLGYTVSCLFTSSFTGLVVCLLLADSDMSIYTLSAVCGLAGNIGVGLLNILTGIPQRILEKTIGENLVGAWDGSERRQRGGKPGKPEDDNV